MYYIDTYLNRHNLLDAVVLTSSEYVLANVKKFSSNINKVEYKNNDVLNGFIGLFVLDNLAWGIVIVSLNKPTGRNALLSSLLERFTLEEMVAVGIYSIIPFKHIDCSTIPLLPVVR